TYVQLDRNHSLPIVNFLNVQDSEHKIFVPLAALVVASRFTSYNDVAFMYCIFGVVAISCLVMMNIGLKVLSDRKYAWLALLPLPWLVFSIRSYENLLWGIQFTITLCVLFVLGTIFQLDRSRRLDASFVLGGLTALCATYCMANGVVVWPLGLLQL